MRLDTKSTPAMRRDHREAGTRGGGRGGTGAGTEGGQTIRSKEDGEEGKCERREEREFELFDPLCSLFHSACPVPISIS